MDCGLQCVDKYGINKCIEMALDHIDPTNERDYHISFDIDALDRHEAPCTGYSRKCSVFFNFQLILLFSTLSRSLHTVPGGLTLREGTRIIDRVFESGRLCGLDVVEVGPKIGDAKDVKTTVDSAIQLITAAMGNRRSGNLPSKPTDLPRN